MKRLVGTWNGEPVWEDDELGEFDAALLPAAPQTGCEFQ